MKRLGLIAILGIAALAAGCMSDKGARPILAPNSRLIYHNAEGQSVYSVCDRGNRLYMSERGLAQVIPGGCPDGQP